MDPFGISERVVQFSIDRVVGYLVPSQAEREAAFELLVELSTRTTVAPLASDQGSLREALSSIYLVFDKTRVLLRKHGIEVAKDHHDGNVSFGVLAVRVLNDVLRPTLSKWHPQLEDWEALRPERMGKAEWERRWKQNGDCRKELDALREGVRAYIDTLGRISGAPGLAAAALPLPASRPLGQEVVAHGAANVDLGADVPRRRMVHWFELGQLVRLAGALARKARRSPTDDTSFIDRSDRHGEFWFDYVADLGDGFDPTMAVAWQLGRTRLDLPVSAAGDLPQPPDSLPRGELLVFGGDTVYPYASADNYLQQVVLPYRLAWAPSVPPGPRPTVVAIPGNHDWIGGINHFEDIFVVKPADEPADDLADGSVPEPGPLPFADHWDAWQRARWFAVKLPHGWWLWGVDTGLHNQISKEQQRYFEAISESVQEGDRIVLCTPVPLWQLRQKHDRCYFDLRSFLDRLVRGRQATMPLFLAGDSHFFAHYRRSDGGPAEHHVTAGGGGAFLHPTNNLVETIPYERGQPEYSLTRRWPSADDSRGLQPRLRGVLTRQFLSLVPLVAALHLLFAAAVTFDATVGAGTRDPDPHSVWWASVTWTIRAWPGWIVLLAALLIGFVVTRPNSDEVWLTAGARKWGLVHGAVQALIVLLAAVVGRWRGPDQWWWHVAVIPLVGAVASLAAFLAMTNLINRRIRANDNTAFSAVHSTRFKHFLRLRIDDKGVLTIFAVGLDPVGKDWFGALSDDPPRLVPPYDPAGSPRLHYLWGVDIQGPPPKGQTVIDQPKQAATRPTPGDRSATSTTGPGPGRGKPLTVYVAWHPHDPEGAVIGRRILTTLQGDPQRPAGERIGIPVRFRTALAGGRAPEPPTELKLDTAEPAVVAIVAGPHLLGSAPWRAWARTVRAEVQRVQVDDKVGHRLVVLATSPHALGASDLFGTIAALRLIGLDPEAQTRTALISVLAATADLLVSASAERLKIFISHAKSDGAVLAGELDQRIARAKLGAFLDSHTIVEGLQFDDVINKATGDREGATVAVVTDAYASREWCRIEALQVKRLGLPLVALDAVKSGQERSLPYLGNVPLVRDSDDREAVFDEVLIALLREVVRSRWFPGHVARLGGEQNGLLVMSRPPELLTVLHLLGENPGASSIIYPDPPLATNELAVLENAAKGPKFVTPTTLNRRTTRV